MKFVCSNCKSKYQIADEKAAGRTLRMVCRRCNNEIVIQGSPAPGGTGAGRDPRLDVSAPPPAAASALAADFRRQVASGGSDLSSSLVSDEWHVAINDIPVGPMRREEVVRKIALGAVTPESLAWREGLDDWVPAADIPELAMLFGAQLRAPAAPAEVRPAARARMVPVGGRVGVEASPAMIEDIEIPAQAPEPFERLSSAGSMPAHAAPAPTDGQSAGRMFMLMCGGVFVMFVGVLLGVKVLTPAPPVVAAAAPAAAAAAAGNVAEEAEAEDTDNVIALDMQEIDGEALGGRGRGKSGSDANKKASGSTGPRLTAAEQAMLDQMSGGGATANIKARPSSASGEQAQGSGEGLTASQLSAVVNKKRSELQRCYEAALRATASDETVRFDVDITVGTSGSVIKVATRGKALAGMDVCIERTVRLWRFPTSGDNTQMSFPVLFQPGA